ncbi:MAG: YdeI/OmpD-associated family protein [Blastocatellia bacterium]|nr:YdeI/OmpD-associated family protein [Blastocatellia bacterium]MDQ3220999.1 YdeI/OmpD-associated family protein [Acidobacteriota bacterium]
MPTRDPRIDAYIERSAEFAQPILLHIRALVHKACPDIVETMKWSMPFFDHKGTVCNMASFKQHCAFGLWKQSLMEANAFPAEKTAMGSFGRITSIAELPDDKIIVALIHQAIKLNQDGIKVKRTPVSKEKKELAVPEVMDAALAKNAAARKTFDEFPYSKKKDYIEWINEAKTEATREKRLTTTIEQLAEGKARHWKYEKC